MIMDQFVKLKILVNWKIAEKCLKFGLIFYLIASTQAIRCHECTDPDGTKDCISKACTGKYCYKADGITSEGTRSMKKGCVNTGIPGPCKEESIKLPGIEPINGHWCVCDSDWCNAASPNGLSGQHINALLLIAFLVSWMSGRLLIR